MEMFDTLDDALAQVTDEEIQKELSLMESMGFEAYYQSLFDDSEENCESCGGPTYSTSPRPWACSVRCYGDIMRI